MYSGRRDVEMWGVFTETSFGQNPLYGYKYESMIAEAIANADSAIDECCGVPEGFFTPGGIELVRELHDGANLGCSGWNSPWTGGDALLMFLDYSPVLSITSVEENMSGTVWTTRIQGRNSEYYPVQNGLRWVNYTPAWDYANIRVTYKAGYVVTPRIISQCSARLAAVTLQNIIDSSMRGGSGSGGSTGQSNSFTSEGMTMSSSNNNANNTLTGRMIGANLTPDLQSLISNYVRRPMVKWAW